jgi:hypothetical protein
MKKAIARSYAEPSRNGSSTHYMGIATALLFACLLTLNVVAY